MDASKQDLAFDPADEVVPAEPNAPAVHPAEPDTKTPNASTVMDTAKEIGADIIQGVQHGASDATQELKSRAGFGEPETPQDPRSTLDGLVADITRVGLGMGVGAAAVAGTVAAAGVAVPAAAVTVGGVLLGSALVGKPSTDNPFNHLAEYPWLKDALGPLASNPGDNEIVKMAKLHLADLVGLKAGEKIVDGARLIYMKAKGTFSPAEIEKAEAVVMKGHADTKAEAAPTVEELNPVKNLQPAKNEVKSFLRSEVESGAIPEGSAFRGGSIGELRQILKDGKLVVGADAEGTPGISAAILKKGEDATIYGDGVGYILPKGQHADSGRLGEVLGNEKLNPNTIDYIVGGKKVAFKDLGAALDEFEGKAAGLPKGEKVVPQTAIPPVVKPPITLRTADGSSGVTLTPANQAKFEKAMDKVIIRDTVQGTTPPAAGPRAKEGSMNMAHQDSPAGVLQGLIELGNITKSQLGPKIRGMEEVRATSGYLGMHEDELRAALKGANMSVEHIDSIATGTRQLIQTKGAEMFAAGRKAMLSGDPEAKAAYQKIWLDLSEVQAQFAQLQTGLGRGLHSLGVEIGPFDRAAVAAKLADPKESAKLERLIAATDGDADKIMHVLKMQQLSWFQKAVGTHNEYWSGLGLLSRAATQTVNLGATAVNVLMEPAAMIVGGVEQGITGHGWASAREGAAYYGHLRTSIMDSLHMAWQAMKTEQAIISQAGTMEQKTHYISALTYNMNPDTYGGKFIDLMGNITRASFRGLTAGDEFFKQLSYRAKVSATASREAMDLVKAGQLERKDVASYVATQLQASLDDMGRATNQDALKFAEKSAFVNDLKGATWGDYTSIGETMARVSSSNQIIRGVLLPFIKTPTNVTRTTFEYTPLIGQLRKQFTADVQAGGEKQALAIGKLTIGSGMYAGAAMLAIEGRITGAPPAPGVIMPAGWKPYSFVFHGEHLGGGPDIYISYQRMQPFGDILGLTADFAKSSGMLDENTRDGLANSMSLALGKMFEGDMSPLTNTATAVGASYGKSLISKTYFRTMTEFFSTFSGYNNEAALVRWVQNYAASHVPGAIAQFNSDDTVREVRSTLDAIMARIPGLSQMLPAKRDYFGQVHDVKMGWPYSIVQPLAVSGTKVDPVMYELNRLATNSHAQTKFTEPEHNMAIAGKKVDLKLVKKEGENVTAYDRMLDLLQTVKPVGEHLTFHEKLDEVMKSHRYQLGKESDLLDGNPLEPGLRQNLIKREESKYRTSALEAVKNEYKVELGIESARKDALETKIGRKKIAVGVYDKILELNK